MTWHYLVLTIHLLLCFFLVGLVLIQQGKGADMGASLGGGGSNTIFGAGGATSLIVKTTTVAAILFMFTSILLVRSYKSGFFTTPIASNALQGSVMSGEQPVSPLDKKIADKPAEKAPETVK